MSSLSMTFKNSKEYVIMNRYFCLVAVLLSILPPACGNDFALQGNDTTSIECFCLYLEDPVITPTECKERIIAYGDTLAYDTLKLYFDFGEKEWDIVQRYTFILSDKFNYTPAKLQMFIYFAHVYATVGRMPMDTTMWNCIFDYVQATTNRDTTIAKKIHNNEHNYIKKTIVDSLSRYDTIVTPIEPQDSAAYRVFCQNQFVNFCILQDQQPNYEDNFSYALIMADKYHYPKAYTDVYKYIVNIYKSNHMIMPQAMQKLALNFLRKGAELNDSTALVEMLNIQYGQHLIEKPYNVIPISKE